MKRIIEKLHLTDRQYMMLGTLMALTGVFLSVAVFFVVGYSEALGVVLVLFALENGVMGYFFRKISSEIDESKDPLRREEHKLSSKNKKVTVFITATLAVLFAVVVSGLFVYIDRQRTIELTQKEVTQSVAADENSYSKKDNKDIVVYVTPSGQRYHKDEKCAGQRAMAVTLEEALNHSLTPCNKCAV